MCDSEVEVTPEEIAASESQRSTENLPLMSCPFCGSEDQRGLNCTDCGQHLGGG